MRVLFLDMDGVVNTIEDKYCVSLNINMKINDGLDYHRCQFDPRLIFNFIKLLEFCKNSDIKIAISSTWRIGTTADDWNKFLNEHFGRASSYKLDDIVIGLTPVDGRDRGLQIQTIIEYLWVTGDENEDVDYLIIDDDVDDILPYHNKERVIKVDPTKGLDDDTLNTIFNKFMGGK